MSKTEVQELKIAAEAEERRINGILVEAGASDKRVRALQPIVANTAWMLVKLEDAREQIKASNVAIAYDNGGGQKGIRENPAYKGYEALWKSYMLGMSKILDALPAEAVADAEPEEDVKPQTVLSLIRQRHA